MLSYFKEFITYLQKIFLGGIHYFLSIFDIIGIALFFIPQFSIWLNLNIEIVRTIGIVMILSSFLLANFSLFRNSYQENRIIFEDIKVKASDISTELIVFTQNDIVIKDNILITIVITGFFQNTGQGTNTRVVVESITPNIIENYKNIEIRLRNQVKPSNRIEDLDNPRFVTTDEMKNIQILLTIPFNTKQIEKRFGSIYSFNKFDVTFGFQQPGKRILLYKVSCDLSKAQNSLIEHMANQISHLGNRQISGIQVVNLLKRYFCK